MASILGFFFLIIIIVLIFGLSIVSGILKLLFGFGRKSTAQNQEKRSYQNTYHKEESREDYSKTDSNHERKKIFDKEDGEYVDFEEVKEDKE